MGEHRSLHRLALQAGAPGDFSYLRNAHPTGLAAEGARRARRRTRACSSPPAWRPRRQPCSGSSAPARPSRSRTGAYYGVRRALRELERWGLSVRRVRPDGLATDRKLIWSGSRRRRIPFLTFPDLDAAAAHPAPVLVDATASTPVLLRPLEHGADVVLHSATKYLGGHHDVLLGALVCRGQETRERLLESAHAHRWRRLSGRRLACCCAASRRCRSASSASRRRRSSWPAGWRPTRRWSASAIPVSAPTRSRHAGCKAASAACSRSTCAATPRPVECSTELITNATSLGGVHSTIESRRRWEGERVPEGLLRLSVGLEDVDALWADLEQALTAA